MKVTNSILYKLKLKAIDNVYDQNLNKLLRVRNSIAHGDQGIPTAQLDLNNFTLLVQDIAAELIASVIDGYKSKVYVSKHVEEQLTDSLRSTQIEA